VIVQMMVFFMVKDLVIPKKIIVQFIVAVKD